ncbi:SIS domain-containing protein [bacterium 210820-DFI.6.52]|nr:SIS domain-containing protein [bacterium 210820-DFI.6.52]
MDKKQYDSAGARQSRYTPEFGKLILQNMAAPKISEVIPAEELLAVHRVYITGCGDSYLAGLSALPAFQALSGVKCTAVKATDFARHLPAEKIEGALVIGISISGTVSRVAECLQRAVKHGGVALAISDNPESLVATSANYVLPLGMPQLEPAPGVCSYVASTLALFCLAHHIGRVNGSNDLTHEQFTACITAHLDQAAAALPAMEEACFAAAQDLQNCRAFDFVSDGESRSTAVFGQAKMVEFFGGLVTGDDCEDWCHINYFTEEPSTLGTFITIFADSPSLSRTKELVQCAVNIGRKVYVITDCAPGTFAEGAHIIALPTPEHTWVRPIVSHLPYDFIGAFISELKGVPPFRAYEGAVWRTPEGSSHIRDSEIVVL